jgi:AcrR family transcriptional regulator
MTAHARPGGDVPDPAAGAPRARILAGLAATLGSKGYAQTTIADIAAAARVSRSTVYEQFGDKDGVLIALYTDLSDRMLATIAATIEGQGRTLPWRERIAGVIGSYLDAISRVPPGERLSLLEIASAGPAARRERRANLDRFAGAVSFATVELGRTVPGVRPLSVPLAYAMVGAVNELVLQAAEEGPEAVRALAPLVTELVERLMDDPSAGRAG